jgi:glucosyl-dolichyl phosphate glucuronosyltransferase
MDISVVVCTRNRAEPLRAFLNSVANLEAPADTAWEIVIVDNGSSDATPEVIAAFADRLPVRTVREETPGLSNARNAGVEAARGRYICWTDDDVELDPRWLSAYADAFRKRPDAAVFGGRIVPVLLPPTPRWFRRLSHSWPITDILALRDFGQSDVPIDFERGHVPWGANFAVRTEDQRRFRYDPRLGVSPQQRRSGEETQLIYELIRSGACGWWLPDPVVRHLYPPQRQTRRYFYDHFYAIGETWAYLEGAYGHHYMNRDGSGSKLLSKPVEALRLRSRVEKALYLALTATGMIRRSLYSLMRAAMCDGAADYRIRGPAGSGPASE